MNALNTVIGLLVVISLITTILSLAGKAPLGVAVLLLDVAALIYILPLGK